MSKLAFDNEQYLRTQSAHIRERISQFGGKLYLEFGGKLYDDNHAARVLPGFQPDSKLRMLLQMKEQVEVVIVINADDIEKNKIRGDLGITYDRDVIRLIGVFRDFGLYVSSVVLTRTTARPSPRPSRRGWRPWASGCTITLISPAIRRIPPMPSAKRASAKMIISKPAGSWWSSPPRAPAAANWPPA